MPARIPENTRWEVIEKWMLGYPRNAIAIECGVSNGAVTSIVDEWRRSTGPQLAILVREIGVTLRNLVTELATENGKAVEGEEAAKTFVSDIENHYPDYLRLRSNVNQLKADEAALRDLPIATEGLGAAVSVYLRRKPTASDIKEVTMLLEGYPKAPTGSSSVENPERPSSY